MVPSPWSRRVTARFAAPAPTENGLLWKATATDQKLPKIEQIKVDSQSLREPVRQEFMNDEIFVSHVSRFNHKGGPPHPTVCSQSNAEYLRRFLFPVEAHAHGWLRSPPCMR
jgi:hypothetical protein